MNIFDIYLGKIKKLVIKLNKENVIEIPESLNGINVDVPVLTKTYINVDSNGVQNESVIRDIAFTAATGTVQVVVDRGLRRFHVVANAWVYDTDIASSGGLW